MTCVITVINVFAKYTLGVYALIGLFLTVLTGMRPPPPTQFMLINVNCKNYIYISHFTVGTCPSSTPHSK